MSTESQKAIVELAVFREFAAKSGLALDPGSERKGIAALGEPDVLCTVAGESVAFELAEACAPEFAAAVSAAVRAEGKVAVAWGDDGSHVTLRKKLGKHYTVKCPLHLLLYVNGLTALPDEMIIERLQPELVHGLGPFSCVWLLGARVHKVAAV
jgi:hypothetical protein